MKHTRTTQTLFIIIFFLLTALSFFKLYTYFLNKDFQIRNSENTIFILLSNGSYLDLNSINDVIDDQISSFVKPFPETLQSNYEKTAQFPFQTTKIVQTSAKRKASIEKSGSKQLKVRIDAELSASVTENHYYYVQLDYSNRFSPVEGDDYIEISDNKCNITIYKKDNYKYKVIDDKSVRVGVRYEPEVTLDINLDIDCEL